MIEMWSTESAGSVRLSAMLVLALGSIIGYTCAPPATSPERAPIQATGPESR
jgi:hypothetical protein